MNYDDINDSELMMMIKEEDDTPKDILFNKYYYIVDIITKKYKKMALKLGIDLRDLQQEALFGFTNAINRYREDDKASLKTFISLCIERRLKNSIIKASRKKNQIFNKALSLEHIYDKYDNSLGDVISDNDQNNPLTKLTSKERYDDLVNDILSSLSKKEKDVLFLMIDGFSYTQIASIIDVSAKSIDNTINRIKSKVKDIIVLNNLK